MKNSDISEKLRLILEKRNQNIHENRIKRLDRLDERLAKLSRDLDRLERIQRSQSRYIAQRTGYIE